MLTEEHIKIIKNDLKKEKEVVYPFLELTQQDIQKLKILRIKTERTTTTLSHFLVEGTYEKECWKLTKTVGDIL